MHISINSLYKITTPYIQKQTSTSLPVTRPESELIRPITFTSNPVVTRTISSQIAQEKSKLLRYLKEILAMDVPILSEPEKIFIQAQRALSLKKRIQKREEEIEIEMRCLVDCDFLNPQQKMDKAQQLKREFEKLRKLKPVEQPQKQPAKDNFDFALINKFKNAILSDNFDLQQVQKEHYKELANIETEDDFRKKYPSIRIPSNPKKVIVNKIIDTLNHKFYMDLDAIIETHDPDAATFFLMKYFDKNFVELATQFSSKTPETLIEEIGFDIVKAIIEKYEQLKITESFDSIPQARKNSIPKISNFERELFEINFDDFLISTIKKIYLDGEKFNKIEYFKDGHKINIASIIEKDYRFEKIPEKMKSIFASAQKVLKLQREYSKFTIGELQTRLAYYLGTEIGNNDKLFSLIIDFDACKFTEEDKQYLIKFLETLDKIIDKEITSDEALDIIEKNNIRPHGTAKLNESERQQLEEKIKQEKEKILGLKLLREEFDGIISNLYEINLYSIAERFSKYYPEIYAEEDIEKTKKAINIVKKYLPLKDSEKIKNAILREEIYEEYAHAQADSEVFQEAIQYAQNFSKKDFEQKCGQYLLNREIIENYPASSNMVANAKLLARIIERFGNNKNLATVYLCKYEDYCLLSKAERNSIFNILKIFDAKDADDKIILKNIIEKDYINSDTIAFMNEGSQSQEITIASKAKKAIFDKYKFPGCLDLFVAFEEAMTMKATETGSSGIKKFGSNNNALEHKIEIKIMGYPDRLFSSNNNYKFDIYSEKGLH